MVWAVSLSTLELSPQGLTPGVQIQPQSVADPPSSLAETVFGVWLGLVGG